MLRSIVVLAFVFQLSSAIAPPIAAPGTASGPLLTTDGNVTFYLPIGGQLAVQWFNPSSGAPLNSPIRLVSTIDLSNLRNNIMGVIGTIRSQHQEATDSIISTLQATQQASLDRLSEIVANATSTMVDMRNLNVINGKIESIVEGLVNGTLGQNPLQSELASKLVFGPTCQCFNPFAFALAAARTSAIVRGSSVSRDCEQQGLLYQDSTGSCRWSTSTPDCGSRIPGLDAHATSACGRLPGSTRLGSTCVATCIVGYSGGASSTYTCQSNGLWTGSLSCPADSCQPIIGSITNGQISSSVQSLGGVSTFSCDSGFYLVGASTSVCQAGGVWSVSTLPVCQPFCPPLTAPVNANVTMPATLTTGRVAVYTCASGFAPVGIASVVCNDLGQWSAPAPMCVESCSSPAPNAFSLSMVPGTRYGGSVFYSCPYGQITSGNPRASFCRADGTWSNPTPSLSCSSSSSCPAFSSGVPCTCNPGYNGRISYTTSTGTYSGNCSIAACPTGFAPSVVTPPICLCNNSLGLYGSLVWISPIQDYTGGCATSGFSTDRGFIFGSDGLTQYISNSFDDAFFQAPELPFQFFAFGVNYQSSLYVGSNSYITFGFGSRNYFGLSASNPGRGLIIQAADNSYQRVWAGVVSGSKMRVYWEGTSSTGGTPGFPNMVWETTFYSNNNIMVVVSLMGRSGAQYGISDGSQYVIQPPFAADTSFAIMTDNQGSTWSYSSGSFFG